MAASSTSRTDSSARGCTRMPSSTCRARAARPASSTVTPDSLAISMLTCFLLASEPKGRTLAGPVACAARPAAGDPFRILGRCPARVIALIGVHDVRHQLVPDHVVAGQPREVHVIDAVEYVLDYAQAADLPGRQVDLGNVAGHHDLGTETEPGQEHLHRLGGGVLRRVEGDRR